MAKKTSKTAEQTKQAKKGPQPRRAKASAEAPEEAQRLGRGGQNARRDQTSHDLPRDRPKRLAAKGYWTSPGGATPCGHVERRDRAGRSSSRGPTPGS